LYKQIAAKSLIDFMLFYQIAQTHLELLPFYEFATNRTSVYDICAINSAGRTNHFVCWPLQDIANIFFIFFLQ